VTGRPLRVAVVAGPDPGHAFPAAALTLRLARAGHTARLYTGDRFARQYAAAGIDHATLPLLELPPGRPDDDFGARLHRRAAEMAVPLADMLRAYRPDVVVADVLTAAGALAAELVGATWIELVPHLLHLPSRALPPPGSGLPPARGPGGRLRDAVLRRMHQRSLDAGRRQREAVRAELGLPPRQPEPTRRLVATLPALEYPRPDWPGTAHIVGPLHWDPADWDAGADRDLDVPPGAGPLVFCAGSTAASGRAGLMEAAIAALAHLPHARLAGTTLEPYPRQLPTSARVAPGRMAPLLRQAAVAILGGGHGGVSKALGYGVPVVVVPGGGDQREVAQRVAWAGAGVVVRKPDPVLLAEAVRAVLSRPAYRTGAERVAAALPEDDPVSLIATGSAECAPPREPAE
jgi:UDP:flavonoid glycosyltransferase YjiC (YdhE family)